MTGTINLAADLGEGFGSYRMADDDAMLDLVSSANIACGFHAGDPRVMDEMVASCVERGVAIGAHPGFPDMVGFGRRTLDCSPREVYTDVLYQLGALAAFAQARGARIHHLTPHGRLGSLSRQRSDYAQAIVDAVENFDATIRIVSREGLLVQTALDRGLRIGYSGFADRAYGDDGELVPRSQPGSVITDHEEVLDRVIQIATQKKVRSVSGKDLSIRCDTIMVHGDSPGAVKIARAVLEGLGRSGITVAPLSD